MERKLGEKRERFLEKAPMSDFDYGRIQARKDLKGLGKKIKRNLSPNRTIIF